MGTPGQQATVTTVAASASSVTLFAAAGGGQGRTVDNNSAATLYLLFGSPASASNFTVEIAPGGYYEFELPLFLGLVTGIWTSATGSADVTSW